MRAAFVVLAALAVAPPAAAQIAVRADSLYTMVDAPIADAVVLIDAAGKIAAVGPAARVPVPEGYRTLSARVVTPGLIDAHSVVGLAGILNSDADQDQLERSDPIQPELRALDAYDTRERLIDWVRSFGVTTLHTGHGPGALVSGQTMIVKTRGATVADAVVDTLAAVAMTLGPDVSRTFAPKAPGTRAKGMAMLRAELVKAREYARRQRGRGPAPAQAPARGADSTADSASAGGRDLGLEVLVAVLDGRIPVVMTAQKAGEIMAALRLRDEFGFRLILDGAAESYLVLDEIREAGVPVIVHPTMVRPGGVTENATVETARLLQEAGIPIAFQSGYESYVPKTRVVLFEAAVAAANGLPRDQALAALTIGAARILGIDGRVGSIEVGKDGDLVLFDGDPFEYTTHVCAVIIEGAVESDECR